MNFKEIFVLELSKHNIKWCLGCDRRKGHKRGFVFADDKHTIHYDNKIVTRKGLYGGFHEMGHCLDTEKGLRRFEQEQKAEDFAKSKMREYGIACPRDRVSLGIKYIARKKRHGDNIRKGFR